MAQYPSVSYSKNSNMELLDGRPIGRASNGKLRYRTMWDVPKWKLSLHHPAATQAEFDAIMNHYTAHRNTNFTVYFNNASYSVVYSETPKVTPVGAGLWEIRSEFEQ